MNTAFKLEELNQFSGSEQFFKHGLNRKLVYTEGIQYLAEKTKCYWMIDVIALVFYPVLLKKHKDYFYSIKFIAREDKSGLFTVEDGNNNVHFTHRIKYTSFPILEKPVRFYLCESEDCYCLMLTGEY
ncbi:MAG: DUF6876 family protein [Gammaproteobacteria bacterium]